MSELTISASYARALMQLAVSKGASRAVLAQRSGLDPAQLQDGDGRIPFAKFVALMRAGQDLSHDPALALHFGEAFEPGEFSIGGIIGMFAETGADCLAVANRYGPLAVETRGLERRDRLVLQRTGRHVWIVDTREDPNDFPELTECTFARWACTARRFAGDSPSARAVHVTHPAPGSRAEYDRIFQVPVVFESNKNAVLLADDGWLSRRLPFASRAALGALTKHADALLEKLELSKSTRGRVESLLIPMLHTGEASVEAVAASLGVSRQTLFRRLKAEGATFERVLDALRCKVALECLEGGRTSVHATAYRLGFSEPAAFSRAFKRWTGCSPRAYVSTHTAAAS